VRIATWNVNSLNVRLPRVEEWLGLQQPDVLCLQETKQSDEKFPAAALRALGYESIHHGEGRWNGVAIMSRVGLEDVMLGFGSDEDAYGARLVSASCGGIRVMSAYVPNGRSLDSEHFEIKLRWLARLGELMGHYGPDDHVAVLGDFNVAPCDADVWDMAALEGMTHVSPQERQAVRALEEAGFEDVFRRFHPEGGIFSWWDYRDGAFHKGHGMRIDLVLASQALSARARDAFVDREARKGVKPSDHAPVVVDFDD
jgi:exodeoxyribonuclease-3